MRGRRIHRVYNMIACHYRGKIKLLKPEDYREWRGILMRDTDDVEDFRFTMATAMGLGKDSFRLRWWEWKFCRRLNFIDWTRLRDPVHRLDAADAQEFIDDFLEVYRHRHWSRVSISSEWVSSELPDDTNEEPDDLDELIVVKVHARRTLLDWALGRFGEPGESKLIYQPAITGLHGLSDDFYLYVGESCYHFSEDGIVEVDDDDAEIDGPLLDEDDDSERTRSATLGAC